MNDKLKIIFLDIDGVLNSYCGEIKRNFEDKILPLFVEHIEVLNWVLKNTDARIVISSCWRYSRSVDELKELFYNYGINSKYIIDKTPRLKSERIEGFDDKWTSVKRGQEIQAWIDKFLNEGNYIESFAIVDDDSDMERLLPDLIQINGNYGLTYKEGLDIICKLNDIEAFEFFKIK
jgi:hypothetical protein